jgi:hypothetical protein
MIASNETIAGGAATTTPRPVTLAEVELATKAFSEAHDALCALVSQMNEDVSAAQRPYLKRIRAAVDRAATAKTNLRLAIDYGRTLFDKPRSRTFHGVKVGLQLSKGGISYEDADRTVALLRKAFGENAVAYIHTKETPDLKMLEDLPPEELTSLGCTVVKQVDQIVIKPTDSAVEKMVEALLKDATEVEVDS